MGNNEFVKYCKELVREYMDNRDIDPNHEEKIYVVWISKVLQNNKALLSTTYVDTRYYEITYNGTEDEFYFDAYTKELNQCVKRKLLDEVMS